MTRPVINQLPEKKPVVGKDVNLQFSGKADDLLEALPDFTDEIDSVESWVIDQDIISKSLKDDIEDLEEIVNDNFSIIANNHSSVISNMDDSVTYIQGNISDLELIESRTESLVNFEGLWENLSGSFPENHSVKKGERYYRSIITIPDVSLSDPEVSSDWEEMVNIGNNPVGVAGDVLMTTDDLSSSDEWLPFDDSTYLKSQYPELAELIGNPDRNYLSGFGKRSPLSGILIPDNFVSVLTGYHENHSATNLLYRSTDFSSIYVRVARKNSQGEYEFIPESATSNRTIDFGQSGGSGFQWLSDDVFCYNSRNSTNLNYRRILSNGTTVSVTGPNPSVYNDGNNVGLSFIFNPFNNRHIITYQTSQNDFNSDTRIWTVTSGSVTASSVLRSGVPTYSGYFKNANTYFMIDSSNLIRKFEISTNSETEVDSGFINTQFDLTSHSLFRIFNFNKRMPLRNLEVPLIGYFTATEGNGLMVIDLSGDFPEIIYEALLSDLGIDGAFFHTSQNALVSTNSFSSNERILLSNNTVNTDIVAVEWDGEFKWSIIEGTPQTGFTSLRNYIEGFGFTSVNFSANGNPVPSMEIPDPPFNKDIEFFIPSLEEIVTSKPTIDKWSLTPLKGYIRNKTNTGV